MDNYQRLIQHVHGRHNIEVSLERIELMILYYGGIFANACNYRLYDDIGKPELINFFGMLFLDSSSGKDFLKSTTGEIFKKIDKNMPSVINSVLSNQNYGDSSIPEQFKNKKLADYETSISSSNIGLYILSLLTNNACIGSLNIAINEFGDIIGKAENINMLKEMYDGVVMANFVQGNANDDTRPNVYSVPVNMIAYGTPIGIKQSKQKLEVFKGITVSGLYRRSLIYYEDVKVQKLKDQEYHDVQDIIDSYTQHLSDISVGYQDGEYFVRNAENPIDFTDEAREMIDSFRMEMFNKANDNLYDELIPLDRNSYKLIQKVSAIIAILNLDDNINEQSVKYAISIFKRTRDSINSLFEQTPIFETIYTRLSSSSSPMMQTDIIKKLGITRKEFNENIDLVDEYAYRFNKRMKTIGTKLVKYSIDDLEINNLDKMIVSVSSAVIKNPSKQIDYIPKTVPFFGKDTVSIESLVTSDIQSYCLNHFEPSSRAENGHRAEKYIIQGQNMIAFDIDEGMDLDVAFNAIEEYQYILYTTKRHRKDKNGLVCDRYRIVLPTFTEFYVNPTEHKGLIENIADVLGFKIYDVSTRNQGRLWFTNSSAEVFTKSEGNLLDVRCCIPDTETQEKLFINIKDLEGKSGTEVEKRLFGMQKFAIMSSVGAGGKTLLYRNNSMFRIAKFAKDAGLDYDKITRETNNMLYEPLPEREINNIIRKA